MTNFDIQGEKKNQILLSIGMIATDRLTATVRGMNPTNTWPLPQYAFPAMADMLKPVFVHCFPRPPLFISSFTYWLMG